MILTWIFRYTPCFLLSVHIIQYLERSPVSHTHTHTSHCSVSERDLQFRRAISTQGFSCNLGSEGIQSYSPLTKHKKRRVPFRHVQYMLWNWLFYWAGIVVVLFTCKCFLASLVVSLSAFLYNMIRCGRVWPIVFWQSFHVMFSYLRHAVEQCSEELCYDQALVCGCKGKRWEVGKEVVL